MFKYFRDSFRRKKARRVTQEYPPKLDLFELKDHGKVEFANWSNPLVSAIKLSSEMIDFFRQFIKEGDLAIDIGANIGDTTVPLALCTGTSGLTLAFDPNPYVFKILRKNATLNADKVNIVPLPYAISTEENDFFFISSEASFGNGGISATKESSHGKFVYPEKIKGVNLSNFLKKEYPQWLKSFSFVKIDTEGYDKEILKSISDLISTYKPVIIAESFGKSTDAEKIELYETIEHYGYDIFYFEDFNINSSIKKLNNKKDIVNWKETINIYAKPKGNS